MKRLPALIISFTLFLFLMSPAALPQDAAGPKKVKLIKVKDNKAVSTAVILSKIKTKVGDTFSQDLLNDDLKRLYGLGFFKDITIDVSGYEDGVEVAFIVIEKPVIKSIIFKGNKDIRTDHLKNEMSLKEGEMLDDNKLAQDLITLKKFYEKKGFHLAEIDKDVEIDGELNTAAVTIIVDERRLVKIRHVFFDGNESYPDKKILRLITTRPDTLFTSGYFKGDVFEEDLEKIKAFYRTEGFLDMALDAEFEYYNANRDMDITVAIEEGKKYLVGNIEVAGNKLFTTDEVADVIKMTRNRPFSQDGMRLDAVHIQEIYYNRGYIMCRVFPEPVVNKETGRIDITYSIEEDRLIYVNKVDIAGNTKTKDTVIRRELRVYPGEPFSGEKVKRSKERLYNLGYFEDISFDTKETDDPAKRDLLVDVKETKTGEFSFGGGYSSIDKLIGFASISQRNFDILNFPTFTGGGQNLTVRGELGFVRSNYLVSWTDPWIFGFPYSFGFDFYRTTHEKERDVGYGWEEERWGGSARLGKEFMDWLRANLIYRLDRVKISDVPDDVIFDIRREKGANILSSLGAYLTFDTRDNVFSPKKGFYATAGVEDAGGPFFGDFDFLKYTARASYYKSFMSLFVLELSLRGGMVGDYGDSDHVPIYERFYAGGTNSIRGYKERGVGPKDPVTNDPIGGESMLVGNAELTFPIYKDVLNGAVFYDAGNVWKDMGDIGQGNYKHGAGLGIRVKTPIGPVKVDWGYPLSKEKGEEKKGRFYFSISREF